MVSTMVLCRRFSSRTSSGKKHGCVLVLWFGLRTARSKISPALRTTPNKKYITYARYKGLPSTPLLCLGKILGGGTFKRMSFGTTAGSTYNDPLAGVLDMTFLLKERTIASFLSSRACGG